MSLKNYLAVAALLTSGAQLASADTIQLKDAAVTGKILAEKADSIVVDVGYTVLQIPRNAIVGITKASAVAVATATTTTSSATGQFYSANAKPGTVRDV